MSTPADGDGESGPEDRGVDVPPGGRDPRQIVTPYAFRVSDGLMGTPLASPWRRALAMLVDLTAVALVVGVRAATGPLFLVLLAWLAYRATTARARRPVRRPLPRLGLRAVAVLLFLTGAGQGVANVAEALDDGGGSETDVEANAPVTSDGSESLEDALRGTDADVSLGQLRRMSGRLSELGSGDTARARSAAGMLSEDLRSAGLDSSRSANADSLARRWARALEAGDTAAADSARDRLAALLSADRVRPLHREIDVLEEELDETEDELEEAREPPGVLAVLRGIARDLGLGFGTLGLYFTAFLALWDGHTPGKRLLGIRVVRVNGEELGWWGAFSRFGGYAASVATGLIGFLQITWDANRQGLHDRIAGTVVIRESPE